MLAYTTYSRLVVINSKISLCSTSKLNDGLDIVSLIDCCIAKHETSKMANNYNFHVVKQKIA